ncbi:MAG: septum formation initiator family protein [Candidatus Berkelbacteria bacterium]|nr:septum formation initiator family protein [Candidatus Berkelbacteria bacterium]
MAPYLFAMWKKIKESIEKIIPMSLGSLVLFAFVVYLLFIVGKTVASNYNSNKDLAVDEAKLTEMEDQIVSLQNEINYQQTNSFREKEARAKLGYKAPGEKIIALPVDTEAEKQADSGMAAPTIQIPNYRLWWQFFFENNG